MSRAGAPDADAAGRTRAGDGLERRDARALDLGRRDDLGSEGCAAHPDPDAARLRALCERVERAALAAWWTGRCPVRRLAADAAAVPFRRDNPAGRRLRAWALDLVPGIATVLAVADDGRGGALAYGTAGHLGPALALEAALAEAMLAEVALTAPAGHPDRIRNAALAPALAARVAGLEAAGQTVPEEGRVAFAPEALPPAAALARAIGHLRAAGIRGGFADLTHPAIGLPVIRCLCPDLPSARRLGI